MVCCLRLRSSNDRCAISGALSASGAGAGTGIGRGRQLGRETGNGERGKSQTQTRAAPHKSCSIFMLRHVTMGRAVCADTNVYIVYIALYTHTRSHTAACGICNLALLEALNKSETCLPFALAHTRFLCWGALNGILCVCVRLSVWLCVCVCGISAFHASNYQHLQLS